MSTPTTTTRSRRREVTTDLTGRELREIFDAVLPHAGTDDTLPPITMLTLDVTDGWLHVLATDRYTLGIVRHPLPTTWGHFALTLPARAVQAVLRQIKLRATLTIRLTPDGLSIDQTSEPALSYRLPASGEHPLLSDWRAWIAERARLTPDPVLTSPHGVALNAAYLARFRPATRTGAPLEIRPAGRCMLITCGTHFLGLISAMDLTRAHAETPDPLTAWLPAPADGEVAA
ncbi:hypothetical protein GCM10027187_02510 [Streptosporangium sandarakinum]|uniref:DNA polymerase III beta sliding clamp central domain-containing protein n=1 Tax=Streptosporangium sandarakinum TaxID=1260955 RepID=A0A852V3K8_9ACTN|nr:hypothetical protein [Streptosporangium sandarakinum]NYF40465.1 hypothetical protein [Streptosporangium sandarakinum]